MTRHEELSERWEREDAEQAALIAAQTERIATLERDVDRLQAALDEYGDHLEFCEIDPCTCGFTEMAAGDDER